MLIFVALKGAISILLIALFMFNACGVFLVFKIEQTRIRKEMKLTIKQGVPQEELETIVVDATNRDQLVWKHEREFMFQGTMYDIVWKEQLSDGNMRYHCVNDTQETILFADLDDLVKRKMGNKESRSQRLKNVLDRMVTVPSFTYFAGTPRMLEDSVFGYSDATYHSPTLEKDAPPPQLG